MVVTSIPLGNLGLKFLALLDSTAKAILSELPSVERLNSLLPLLSALYRSVISPMYSKVHLLKNFLPLRNLTLSESAVVQSPTRYQIKKSYSSLLVVSRVA